ncbi:MAG: hypothetical protein KGN97_05935 [Bacteroidota bacterium]|jgi:hypothetical protein|nr:hypothetical protein [Bacteroidota bacterium]
MNLFKNIVFCFVILLFAACNSNNNAVSSHLFNRDSFKTHRLDQSIFKLDTNHLVTGLLELKKQYPTFLPFYLDTLMGFGVYNNYTDTSTAIQQGVRKLLTNHDFRGLFDTILQRYPSTNTIDEELINAFQNHKKLFPSFKIPQVIYFNSNLNNWGAITYQDSLHSFVGIGLDMFLGSQFPYYASIGVPSYASAFYTAEFIPVAVMKALYLDLATASSKASSLAEIMIEKGIEQCYLESVLPNTSAALRLLYTDAQWEWCEQEEASIYNYFIKENLLYEKNRNLIVNYIQEGPTTIGMPAESPGNITAYLGYKIVKAYLSKYPKTTIQQLITSKNKLTILTSAGYNP